MSIAGDVLTSATPARLLCRRGTWILELVRLVPVDRNVFQPRTQRLEGADAVLQQLKKAGDHPGLAAAASQLIRGLRPDEDRSFEAVDGDWIPAEPGARRDSTRPSAHPGSSAATELAELRAELLVLRASHERLRERVARLESLQSPRSGAPRDVLAPLSVPVLVMPKISDAPRDEPKSRAEPAPAAEVPTPEPAQKIPPGTGLKFPAVAAINSCLRVLIGEHMTVREKRPVSFSPSHGEARWMSRLINEAGEEVAVIVADLAATITLGGELMALSPEEIAKQKAEKSPSDDVVEAMSEVGNNLNGTINQQLGPDAQVRVKPIEPVSPGALDWTQNAGRSLQLELTGGAGELFFFAR